jgi:pyruvate, water dikinase
MNKHISVDTIISELREREKELNCIYNIEEILKDYDSPLDRIMENVVKVISPGWQYPEFCCAKITIDTTEYLSDNYSESSWLMESNIYETEKTIGNIKVFYKKEFPEIHEGPFLKEERKLINTIAEKLGQYIIHKNLKTIFTTYTTENQTEDKDKWRTIITLLKDTDRNLYIAIARKMMNHLYWSGVKEANILISDKGSSESHQEKFNYDDNKPLAKKKFKDISDEVFKIASEHLSEEEILLKLEKWIQEEKSSYFIRKLEDLSCCLNEISDLVRRFISQLPVHSSLAPELEKSIRVSLTRRFLSEDLSYIKIAKEYLTFTDFYDLIKRVIYTSNSHGKLGGKSAGLLLAANILKSDAKEIYDKIRIPKTWYISSDGVLDFIHYNNLEEVFEQKYKELDIIRQEYPYIVQLFKNSSFAPDMLKYLSVMLEDFGEVPVIVRSSTLLEDGIGAAFSGKYKSLFLANQGPKQKRLEDLTSAIAEIYASVFNTDAIEYRAERGLLDYNEQMGIIVQQVVGKKVGHYYLPAFAGVGFSNNEFRWSPRIKRDDGLLRIVPGLGTRAVDRVSEDYPILVSPGQPGLRVNVSYDEMVKYSPKKIDVINLNTNSFETINVHDLLKEYGNDYPDVSNVFSIYHDGHPLNKFNIDYKESYRDSLVTFDGLIGKTDFIKNIQTIISTLKKSLSYPIDIEFASDGDHLYLLQCRTQSSFRDSTPSPIPKDVPKEKIIFTANKHISNGKVPDITHIVYVVPEAYTDIPDLKTMQEVGRAVGKLNKILPKRQFILMGPGRWGSRGDIKLGVSVTYSDINNTSVLIEIAKKKGNYLPDLSFGTHFFQDLVEASIRYIPLYPDNEVTIFNEMFLSRSKNILYDLLPEYSHLSYIIRVIDVKQSADNQIIRLLSNADLEEAIAYLAIPSGEKETETFSTDAVERKSDIYWRWRFRMVEKIADIIDSKKFGIKGIYVFGSTKNATAGAGSDIDLLIHFNGTEEQRTLLGEWLNGWGVCLAEINYLRTGYKSDNLLDAHIITDEDIKNKNSYAVKIGAITDAARPLKIFEP